MNRPARGQFSTAKTGWIVVLLFFAWLAFLLWPVPRGAPPEAPVPALPPVAAQSRLAEAGLEDNPDWVGLPVLFAVYADRLEWRDGQVCFAYWNPGSRSYSYFFVATRSAAGVRFRAISLGDLRRMHEAGLASDEGMSPEDAAVNSNAPPTHPFVFFRAPSATVPRPLMRPDLERSGNGTPPRVPVDLAPPVSPPPPSP